jgi:hypothetical protein
VVIVVVSRHEEANPNIAGAVARIAAVRGEYLSVIAEKV